MHRIYCQAALVLQQKSTQPNQKLITFCLCPISEDVLETNLTNQQPFVAPRGR